MTLIESEQSKDIRLTQIARGPFFLRFASYRKGEDAKLGLRSEDYIVSELVPEQAVFALCDGVGSSYYGNIGSQFLGETLLNWLGNVPRPQKSDYLDEARAALWLKAVNDKLKNELDARVNFATSVIQNRKAGSKGALIDLAEKTQRDDFGTQSNFAAGVIWPKSRELPNGLVLLFWLGNARLRIFNGTKDLTSLTKWGDNPEQLKEVWSSREGVVGQVYSYLTDFSKITTVIAYSDGMEGVEEDIKPRIEGGSLETTIRRAQSIKDDDVSYLEIFLAQDEADEYSDDIVATIRNQYNVVDTSSSSQPEAGDQDLKRQLESVKKEKNAQSREFERIKNIYRLFTAILFVTTVVFGLSLGYVLGASTVFNNAPTITTTSTFTPIPPSFTPPLTSTATATVAEATATEMPIAFPTSTATAAPIIETPTASLMPVPTETPTP